MSAFNTFTVMLFPGLALLALALGLLSRRYTSPAFVIGLTGLLALTTASTWITVAAPINDSAAVDKLIAQNAELAATVARQKADLEEARERAHEVVARSETAPPQPTAAQLERLEGALRTELSKRAEVEQIAADADRRAAAGTARIAELNETVRRAHNAKIEAERKTALLEDKLQSVQPRPRPPITPDPSRIRRQLVEGGLPNYAIQEERELITGRRGTWYVVRLLQGGKEWNFADRQYVLTDPTEIRASIARLRDDVLAPLSQARQHWQLFVRGAADPRRVIGPVGRELSYLPRLSDGTHSAEPRRTLVTVPVQNEELPTLRADWLREIVRPVLAVVANTDIKILENPPKAGHGRTAELVLYIEW